MPYFTIIIPSFNRAHIIIKSIQSVLEQSFEDFELIIVDDGSTDDTRELVKKYLFNKQIKYIYQNNAGVCAARNAGARLAEGNYLIFLDSDDIVENNWLYDFYAEIENKGADILYCSVKIQNYDNTIEYINVDNPYGNYKGAGIDLAGSWAIKKKIFCEVGMYDEVIKFGENNELRLRINSLNLNIGLIKKYNLVYFASKNGGSKNYQNKINSILYILDKHKDYYNKNRHVKKLFLQTAAVSAVRIKQTKKANHLFKLALSENKTNVKLWLQCFITTSDFLANLTWPKS